MFRSYSFLSPNSSQILPTSWSTEFNVFLSWKKYKTKTKKYIPIQNKTKKYTESMGMLLCLPAASGNQVCPGLWLIICCHSIRENRFSLFQHISIRNSFFFVCFFNNWNLYSLSLPCVGIFFLYWNSAGLIYAVKVSLSLYAYWSCSSWMTMFPWSPTSGFYNPSASSAWSLHSWGEGLNHDIALIAKYLSF